MGLGCVARRDEIPKMKFQSHTQLHVKLASDAIELLIGSDERPLRRIPYANIAICALASDEKAFGEGEEEGESLFLQLIGGEQGEEEGDGEGEGGEIRLLRESHETVESLRELFSSISERVSAAAQDGGGEASDGGGGALASFMFGQYLGSSSDSNNNGEASADEEDEFYFHDESQLGDLTPDQHAKLRKLEEKLVVHSSSSSPDGRKRLHPNQFDDA